MTEPRGGWDDAQRLFDEERDEIEELRCLITIPEVAAALGVQIHAVGLTCPHPDHHQTGHSAPASTFYGDDGIERWKCHPCDAWGDVYDYVIAAGEADDFAGALDVVEEIIDGAPRAVSRAIPSYRRRDPEDPERLRPVRSREGIAECEAYCVSRGWTPTALAEVLGRDRFSFRWDDGYWLRLLAHNDPSQLVPEGACFDHEDGSAHLHARAPWWQDRALSGQRRPDGEEWRWRSPPGYGTQLFTWEPDYVTKRRRMGHDNHGGPRRPYIEETDHRPEVAPLTLVVEGASDWLTAVCAQYWLGHESDHFGIARRFPVVGLPGAGRTGLLAIRNDWVVIMDNDEAGEQARERIDAEQSVKHLYVPEPFHDLNEWWCSVDVEEGQPPPWERRRLWINQLREALTPDHNESEEGPTELEVPHDS